MTKSKSLYFTMVIISIMYMLYITYVNFIHDPQVEVFLSQKTNLNHPLNIPVWLHVMRIHVIFACLGMLAGAINFSTTVLQKYRMFHRMNGYLYTLSIFLVCLTSGYMAPYATGGRINSIAFNLVNMIWLGLTIAALVTIKRKEVNKHRKWMVRSYAFCFLNMFIHLLTSLFHDLFGLPYDTSYTLGVYGSILLTISLAEIVIKYMYKNPTHIIAGQR
jgi:hypothetical protein